MYKSARRASYSALSGRVHSELWQTVWDPLSFIATNPLRARDLYLQVERLVPIRPHDRRWNQSVSNRGLNCALPSRSKGAKALTASFM